MGVRILALYCTGNYRSRSCAGKGATLWTACAGFVLIEDAGETVAQPRHGDGPITLRLTDKVLPASSC